MRWFKTGEWRTWLAAVRICLTNRQQCSKTMKHRFLEQGVAARFSRKACKKSDSGALWMLEKLLELPNAANEGRFFEEGFPVNFVTPAATSGVAGELGLAWRENAPARFGICREPL